MVEIKKNSSSKATPSDLRNKSKKGGDNAGTSNTKQSISKSEICSES